MRKYIRIALTPQEEQTLKSVKAETERATGISMSDSLFVLSVVRQVLKERSRRGGSSSAE